jgi:hypothetical protein
MVILLLTNYNNGHIILRIPNIEIKHIDYSKCSYILIAEDKTFSGLEIFVKTIFFEFNKTYKYSEEKQKLFL